MWIGLTSLSLVIRRRTRAHPRLALATGSRDRAPAAVGDGAGVEAILRGFGEASEEREKGEGRGSVPGRTISEQKEKSR